MCGESGLPSRSAVRHEIIVCILVSQGDFTNNEITGKGLYRWPDSSTYEGEVSNGKRHGHGTFRCMASPASYTGQWNMGQRHGTVSSLRVHASKQESISVVCEFYFSIFIRKTHVQLTLWCHCQSIKAIRLVVVVQPLPVFEDLRCNMYTLPCSC